VANKIYIQIEADSQSAQANVDAFNKGVANIGTESEKASAKATAGFKSVSVGIDQAASSMDRLAQAMTGMGVARFAQEFLGMGDDLNRIRMGFENLAGGAALFTQLQALSQKTGFEMKGLAESAQNLVNAGMNVGLVGARMKILADQAAFAGKNTDSLLTITGKLQQLLAKESVSRRDITAFADIGIRPLEILKDKAHQTFQSIRKDLQDVSAERFIQDLFDFMKKTSAGAAAARTEELPGAQWGNLTSKAQELAQNLETALAPALIAVMKQMSGLIDLGEDALRVFERLPEPIRNTAIALGALALATKLVGAAFALWNMLPSVIGWIAKLGSGLGTLATWMVNIVAGTGELTTVFTAAEAGAAGLGATIATMLPEIFAITAAFAGLALVMKEVFFSEDSEETAAMKKALDDRKQLAQQAQEMADRLRKQRVNVPDPGRSYMSMTVDQVQAQIAALKELQRKQDDLYQANEDKLKRQAKQMDDALAEVQARLARSEDHQIAGLISKYHELEASLKDNATQTARIPQLYAQAAQVVLNDLAKAVDQDGRKIEQEVNRLKRQTDIIAGEIPQTGTFEQQRQQAQRAHDDRVREAQDDAQVALEQRNTQFRAAIQDAYTLAAHKRQLGENEADVRKELIANVAQAEITWGRAVSNEQNKLEAQLAQNDMERNKEVHKADFEDWKQTQEERVAYLEQQAQSAAAIRRARLEAVPAQTEQARLQQIGNLRDAEIDAIKAVSKIREDDLNAQTSKRIEEADSNAKEILEILDDSRKKGDELALQSATDQKLAYINAWKEANDVVMEQQKEVFDSLQTAVGEIFDAFVDKSKSVWSAIGNLIKSTLLNAIKAVITSQVAASLTQMLGYGPVGIQRRGLWGQQAVFSGMGGLPDYAISNVTSGITGLGVPASGGASITTTAPASSSEGSANREVNDEVNQIASDAVQEQARLQAYGIPTPGAQEISGIMGPTGVYVGGGGVSGPGAPYGGYRGGADITSTGGAVAIAPAGAATTRGFGGSIQSLKDSLNIGKPVYVPGDGVTTLGQWKPWSQASATQKLGSIVKSQGFATMATSIGAPMFLASLGKKGVKADISGVIGGAAAGYGLASTFLGSWMGPSGLVAGAGIGLFAAGYKERGIGGLAMTTLGGTLAGAGIGNMIVPGVGAVVGAAIGAAVGLVTGVVNLFRPSQNQQIRTLIRQVYGVDISQNSVLQQISDLADQKYGGSIHQAVYSSDVQDMVRLYALSTGQRIGNMPRPMYSATYAQSAAGGLQLQPVYTGGRIVANPYTGTTTTQIANWQTATQNLPSVFLQLNPAQAVQLFSGQVVQAMGANPGAVSSAVTTANQAGQGRQVQAGSLLEPATVLG
jgi:hypothetical protein